MLFVVGINVGLRVGNLLQLRLKGVYLMAVSVTQFLSRNGRQAR
ncbi:MAG: hypothetical protein H6Q58_799 [Firmicutes bacterium]|nr:hypothetical protein [Bacillota bacterium]